MRTGHAMAFLLMLIVNFACSEPAGPGEVASEFFGHLQHGQPEMARALLSAEVSDELEHQFGGKEIISFVIEDVRISGDGNSAWADWSTEMEPFGPGDTNEGGRLELGRDESGHWVITGFGN